MKVRDFSAVDGCADRVDGEDTLLEPVVARVEAAGDDGPESRAVVGNRLYRGKARDNHGDAGHTAETDATLTQVRTDGKEVRPLGREEHPLLLSASEGGAPAA